jgi:ParB-like chromosome segregation protein Spo0J
MEIRLMDIGELNPAEYNPRRDLQPGDREYEKIARSVEEFGYVEPVVWNKRTGNLVGGHQRLKVLKDRGHTQIEATVIDISEHDEKILNVALNRITGRWDIEKLTDLLTELQELGGLESTGFEEWEPDALKTEYDHIGDLLTDDFSDAGKTESDTFVITFTFPAEEEEAVRKYVENTPNSKTELAAAVIGKVKGVSEE